MKKTLLMVTCVALLDSIAIFALANSLPTSAKPLKAADVQSQIVGHTVINSSWEEYYDPSGKIAGLNTKKNRSYSGTWSLEGDKICFHYTNPVTVRCKAVALDGDQAYFILDNGEIDEYSPWVVKNGNPDNL